jgi:hypothetical protein
MNSFAGERGVILFNYITSDEKPVGSEDNMNRLHLRITQELIEVLLPADAAILVSSKGHRWIVGANAIDPNITRLKPLACLDGRIKILRPD